MNTLKNKWRGMWVKPKESLYSKRLRLVTSFFLALLLLLSITPPSKINYIALAEEPIKLLSIEETIEIYGEEFGVDPNLLYSIMMCESKGNKVVGDGGNAFHEFQFWKETFQRYANLYRKTYGVEDRFDIYSAHDQIKLAAFAFSQGEDSRREWTTYRAIKNGGTYTFYSRALKKTYTVKCNYTEIQ